MIPNEPQLLVEKLHEALDAMRHELSVAESFGLYAGVRMLCDDLDCIANDNGYFFEQTLRIRSHVGAALGFDVDHGQGPTQHRVWALGALSTLKDLL